MFPDVSSVWIFLMIAALGWAIAGPAPRNRGHEDWRQARRQRTWARLAAARAGRRAWRRRVFGSHPLLYGVLFWLSPLLLMALAAWLR